MRAPWGLTVATSAMLLAVSLGASPTKAQTACESQCIALTGGCPLTVLCPGGTFCFGSPAAECIFGTPTADFIIANGGDDCICGDGGDDTIDGDAGADTIFGGDGADTINGGSEADLISGDDGDDTINGNEGNDIILGGIGNDQVFGGAGDDTINGNEGNDILEGGPNDDTISGQEGSDTLRGNGGNDRLDGQAGPDELDGGDGDDMLFGGDENDTLLGGNDADELEGGDGDDFLDGGAGDDPILNGGEGMDRINGGAGNDTANGGPGIDIISGGADDDTLFGGDGPDIINGDGGIDFLSGDADNDRLDGGEPPPAMNTVNGGSGEDVCLNFTDTDFSCDLFTDATVDSVIAFLERGSVVVRWTTSSESGTLGFRLLREEAGERVPVYDGVLPGLLDAPQGGVYDLVDGSASANTTTRYWLEEVEVGGRETLHGPYEATPVSEGESVIAVGQRFGRAAHAFTEVTRVDKSVDIERQSPGEAVAVYLGIEQTGLYVVAAEEIAALLAEDADTVSDWITNGELSLTEGGVSVAWSAGSGGASLAFYGRARESTYTTERLYRLSLGAGDSIAMRSAAPGAASDGLTFVAERHLEDNAIPGILVAQDPNEDYWFWQLITAAEVMPTNATVTFDLEDVAGGGNIAIHLHGIIDTEHAITFELNGSVIGTTEFAGVVPHDVTFSVPDALFADGENTLTVFASEPSDSMVYLDAADVTYTRGYATSANALAFESEADASVAIEGLSGSGPRVFDITNPSQPGELIDFALETNGISLALETDRAYFVATEEAILTPTSMWADVASDLRDTRRRAAYLVIAPAPFVDEAEALAEYRRTDGLTAEVVELQDIYDEFANGTPDPNAIRAFLGFAYENWEERPQFVALVGDGSFDYRDVYGFGGNFVPPLMALTARGILSADRLYGDVVGDDGFPDISVGRLPVATEVELDAAIARIIDYEAALDVTNNQAVLFADATDERRGGDFATLQDSLAASLSGEWTTTSVYRPDFNDVGSARAAFMEAVRASPRLINYFGHAGTTALGLRENLFDVADVASLEVDGAPPIFAMMTCGLSRFAVPTGLLPEGQSLGEAMSLDDDVGVAVIGPSGGSVHEVVETVSASLFDELNAGRETRLGPIVDRALRSLEGAELARELSTVYHVFGDPALVVAKTEGQGPGGSGGTTGSGGTNGSGGSVTSPPVPVGGGCSAAPTRDAPWHWPLVLTLLFLTLRARRKTT